MSAKVSWRGPDVLSFFRARMERRVVESAGLVADRAREMVNTPYPPASRPGRPAHRRTGRYRASIRAEVTRGGWRFGRFYGRVVADAPYAGFLEHGTRRMAARPALGPALAMSMDEVGRIMKARV